MLLRSIGALTLALGAVEGFKNSAPFFMLANRQLDGQVENAQVLSAQHLGDALSFVTGKCAADTYTIVHQPGLTTADLQDSKSFANVKALMAQKKYYSYGEVSNVFGEMDGLVEKVRDTCGAVHEYQGTMPATSRLFQGGNKNILHKKYEALPTEKKARAAELRQRDEDISGYEKTISGRSHIIIFVSSPAATVDEHEHMYEMDEPYPTAMHQDLKRGLEQERRLARNGSRSDNDMQAGLPLFEVYQFLSPGIFMSLAVSLLLIVILWVGVSAIAGLEVSYMAFSKEMGPAAQNKGKQQ